MVTFPKFICVDDLYFVDGGQQYRVLRYSTYAFSSEERFVNEGDVRMIAGVMFYAKHVDKKSSYLFNKRKICWTFVENDENEDAKKTFASLLFNYYMN